MGLPGGYIDFWQSREKIIDLSAWQGWSSLDLRIEAANFRHDAWDRLVRRSTAAQKMRSLQIGRKSFWIFKSGHGRIKHIWDGWKIVFDSFQMIQEIQNEIDYNLSNNRRSLPPPKKEVTLQVHQNLIETLRGKPGKQCSQETLPEIDQIFHLTWFSVDT